MIHRIVIAGGGVAALEAAIALRRLGGDAVSPVLVAPNEEFRFRARDVAEPFGKPASLRVPLAELLAELSIPLVCDRLASVNVVTRIAHTVGGLKLPYHGLLVAVGGTPFPAFAHGISFNPAGGFEDFDELLADVESGLVESVAFVAPESSGWTLPVYDLALMLRNWADARDLRPEIRVVTTESAPLDCFGAPAAREVARVLDDAAIAVTCGSEPVLVSDTTMTAAGHWISADRIVSLPRLAGPRTPGLPCSPDGFLTVGPDGEVPDCPGVYGAGDGTTQPRKHGGLAAQHADRAARVLLRRAGLHVPDPPEPLLLRGALATPDGPLYLEAAATGYGALEASSTASWRPLWDPPSKVATRWLAPFLERPRARPAGGLRRLRPTPVTFARTCSTPPASSA